ncbi:hypothetical protein JTB14_027784 [Gonioctena quinquepunctata]|nr:hypothetical protein JTB14_027784 [Gonioctena quinquepunctata]
MKKGRYLVPLNSFNAQWSRSYLSNIAMWTLLRIIFIIKFHIIYGKLVGDHICLTEESHPINVTETYERNITVRNYQWCYNVPPRCSYYTIKKVNDTRVVDSLLPPKTAISRDVIFSEYEKGNSLLIESSGENIMFFFADSDSGPPSEEFSYEESDDSSGEEQPNLEEDQSDPDFIPSSNPTSVEEVLANPDKENRLEAMDRKYKAQIDNGIWELVDLPSGRKPLKSKWVFEIKKDASGKVTQYKARPVIRGCGQKKDIDYGEKYSPVIRYSSIRYLLVLTAQYNFEIERMDAVTA